MHKYSVDETNLAADFLVESTIPVKNSKYVLQIGISSNVLCSKRAGINTT